jgi:hypothetical protein
MYSQEFKFEDIDASHKVKKELSALNLKTLDSIGVLTKNGELIPYNKFIELFKNKLISFSKISIVSRSEILMINDKITNYKNILVLK